MSSKEPVESKLDAALSLAARGFWIFPIKTGAKLPPLVKFKDAATRNEQTIREWWGLPHHQPNIGIYTGRYRDNEGLVVIDVDPKKGGDNAIFNLEMAGKEIPDTYTQSTPSGGRHIVYHVAIALRQGVDIFGAGLDVRSRGGYILGAGSALTAGLVDYGVARDCPVAACPEWISQHLNTATQRRRNVAQSGGVRSAGQPLGSDRSSAIQGVEGSASQSPQSVMAKARVWLAAQAGAVWGAGGDVGTFAVCCGLFDYGLTSDEVFALLWADWNPRCSPPWSPDELRTKIDNALAYRSDPVGSALPQFAPIVGSGISEPEGVEHTRVLEVRYEAAPMDSITPGRISPTASGHGLILRMSGNRITKKCLPALFADYF